MTVSNQFFGWVTGLGTSVKILGPENVKEEYKSYLHSVIQQY